MVLDRLYKKKLIHPPKWLLDNTSYLTMMGSVVYGVSNDNSDLDIYGFCMPPKELVFPHLAGEIPGFGRQIKRFEQWSEHHIQDPDKKQEYDFSIYSIVKFFHLCMENNPNMVDALFVPRRAILHSTKAAELVRDNRKKFLHKGSFHKFRGYAYAQMSKIRNKTNSSNEKRAASIEEFGFDTKFAYHVIRLALECEQILVTHDLDLERDRNMLKAIRRGEWTLEQIETWFTDKEKHLESLYSTSTLPYEPNEAELKELLMNCLEEHYGDLSAVVQKNKSIDDLVRDIDSVIEKYR